MKRNALLFIFSVVACATLLSAFLHWRARSLETDLRARLKRQADALHAQQQRRVQLTQSGLASADNLKSGLLKLRAEVAELRRSTTNLNALRNAIDILKTEIEVAQNNFSTNSSTPPDPSKVRATWPKDQLAFAGYMDGTSALQSTLWAMSHGQPSAILSAFAPDEIKSLWRDSAANPTAADKDGTSPHAINERDSKLQRLAASLRPVTTFHLVSDDIAPKISDINPAYKIYKVYFEGDGATRGLGFRKVGNELKFVAVFSIGGTDERPTYEGNLWP